MAGKGVRRLLSPFVALQSNCVCRRFHEMQLQKSIHNDQLLTVDVGQVSALYLLDLNAAFDTV